jgi:hypothetical protein
MREPASDATLPSTHGWMWTVARSVAAATVPCTVSYGSTPGAPFDEMRLSTATREVSVLGWAPGAWTTLPPGIGVVVVVAGAIAVERLDDARSATTVLTAGEGIALVACTAHRIGNVGTAPATTVHVTAARTPTP